MQEMETRIIDIDVDIIRDKLGNINAVKVKEEDQINDIYDFNDGRLLSEKGYARIRTVYDHLKDDTRYYMTLKKMISQEKYKLMQEHEIIVSDAFESKKIYEALGLSLVQSIKKYRESYKYKNTLIEIDINDKSFCPFPYIEIESPIEEELIEVVNLLGYSMDDTTSKTIYEILSTKGNLKGI